MERPSPSAYLIWQESDRERRVPLDSGGFWKLGRSAQCKIEISDNTISRNHAMIQLAEDGEYYFIDLGSQNGSFVNDRRVNVPVALKNGDRISVGRTTIVFHDPTQPASKSPRPLSDFDVTRQIIAPRLVTTLVVDIRDYTGFTNRVDQSVLCQVIGNWFSAAERIMQTHGSDVQKYIGDAVMVLWVHQVAHQARRDVLEALRALSKFAEATTGLSQRFGLAEPVRIGAGLNTGPAAVGSPGNRDLTALGESVNTTFRLEKATKELKTDVVLGRVTFDCLRSLPRSSDYFHENEVMLKGYSNPTRAFAISFADLDHFLVQIDSTA